MLVLALTLGITAVICFVLVFSVSQFNTKIVMDPSALRGFKGEKLSANIVLIFKRAKWIGLTTSTVQTPFGLETEHELKGDKVTRLFMKSKYAGRFSGIAVNVEVTDVLNLFSKRVETIHQNFIFDSLPRSLLTPIPRSWPVPLALGERSGKTPGSSLELYALEEYLPFSDTKDILWKRVARMPDEKLIVRIRDSSIPKVIRIGVVERILREKERKLEFADAACEAIGTMAEILLSAGCQVEVFHCSNREEGPIAVHYIQYLDQVPDALMCLSDTSNPSAELEHASTIVEKSDIVVCGKLELEDKFLSFAISKKPTLAIAEQRSFPTIVGERTLIYTGVEDLRKLVSRVLEK